MKVDEFELFKSPQMLQAPVGNCGVIDSEHLKISQTPNAVHCGICDEDIFQYQRFKLR